MELCLQDSEFENIGPQKGTFYGLIIKFWSSLVIELAKKSIIVITKALHHLQSPVYALWLDFTGQAV